MVHLHTWFLASALLALISVPSAFARQTQGRWPLADVRVDGVSRYAAADVVRLSGLAQGAPVSLDDVQQAANRLMETGLFSNLAFAYTTSAAGLTLTLKVQEAAWTVPLAFAVMVLVSLATRRRVPAAVGSTMLRMHAPDALHL